jgi:adenylylsulfate kinase
MQAEKRQGRDREAIVVWFTGLSGSGKSTLAERLVAELSQRGCDVEHLDGDRLRAAFPNTGFTREARNEHIRRVGYMAGLLARHGVTVVASFISPYRESREFARSQCARFVEVYLAASLDECERRDVKGLYAKARRGEIASFTGISDAYEPPERPELSIDTAAHPPEACVRQILGFLEQRGWLPQGRAS